MTLLPRFDAASHAGSDGEEIIYAIPMEGAAAVTTSTKAASTATNTQAAGAAGYGAELPRAQRVSEDLIVEDTFRSQFSTQFSTEFSTDGPPEFSTQSSVISNV